MTHNGILAKDHLPQLVLRRASVRFAGDKTR